MSAASKEPVEKVLSSGQRIKLTEQDEKNLRRVFNHLAGFSRRQHLAQALQAKQDEFRARKQAKESENMGFHRGSTGAGVASGAGGQTAMEAHQERSLGMEVEQLKRELHELESDPGKKISARDLDNALRAFGNPFSRKQVEYMIWEVDEDLDGCVDWEEFQLTYYRNLKDDTGTEPFELFNVIQFLTYDSKFKGFITEDDTMGTLFARYGRDRLEGELQKLFGRKLKSAGGDGCLTLHEYLAVVMKRSSGKRPGAFTPSQGVPALLASLLPSNLPSFISETAHAALTPRASASAGAGGAAATGHHVSMSASSSM